MGFSCMARHKCKKNFKVFLQLLKFQSFLQEQFQCLKCGFLKLANIPVEATRESELIEREMEDATLFPPPSEPEVLFHEVA